MNTTSTIKKLICSTIFNIAFFIATTSLGFCCARGLLEEPKLPNMLLKK